MVDKDVDGDHSYKEHLLDLKKLLTENMTVFGVVVNGSQVEKVSLMGLAKYGPLLEVNEVDHGTDTRIDAYDYLNLPNDVVHVIIGHLGPVYALVFKLLCKRYSWIDVSDYI
jgi:hypothetical protein